MTIAPGLRPNGKSVYHEHCIPTNVKYADSRRESQIRNKIQLGVLACSSQDSKAQLGYHEIMRKPEVNWKCTGSKLEVICKVLKEQFLNNFRFTSGLILT